MLTFSNNHITGFFFLFTTSETVSHSIPKMVKKPSLIPTRQMNRSARVLFERGRPFSRSKVLLCSVSTGAVDL